MTEYISRDKVLKKFIEGDGHDDDRFTEGYNFAVQEHREEVKKIPAADVQPVVHGRWLEHQAIWIDQPEIEGWFVQAKCSECGKWAHVMNPYTKFVDYEQCPYCGARMTKGGDTECQDTE